MFAKWDLLRVEGVEKFQLESFLESLRNKKGISTVPGNGNPTWQQRESPQHGPKETTRPGARSCEYLHQVAIPGPIIKRIASKIKCQVRRGLGVDA